MKKPILAFVFFLTLNVSAVAWADQITAIQVSPASPQAGSPANVTLQGTGTCSSLVFDWGDQSQPYPHGSQFTLPFPLPPHTYANAGSYTLTVTGVKGCVGKGLTKNITVAPKPSGGIGGLTDLCKHIDCGALLAPKIDNFLIFSNFTPGGAIAVLGSGFGAKPGQLHMVGTTAGSFKITDTVVPIIQGGWKNTSIGAKIPNLTGVVEQPIKFYVVTAGNAKSNDSFTVQFRPTQEMKQLPSGDVQVSCSDEADFDACNSVVNDDGIPFCGAPFVSGGGGSMSAFHWTCVGSSNGTDSYSASLKNGWLFNDAALVDVTPEDLFSDDPKFASMSGFKSDVASTNVTVNWNNADASYVLYSVNVSIVGPKGVPHK
ncbi:MAG TPA: hypothetical protein VGA73_07810 [Candidatus Binatia bacterium]